MNKQIIKSLDMKITGEILAQSFPKRQGGTSFTTFLQTKKGQFVWKVATELPYREWLKKEAEVMELLNKETELPIPLFMHYKEQPEENSLLMSKLEGVPLREALHVANTMEEKKSLFYSFGTLLKLLHATMPPKALLIEDNWLEKQLQTATYNVMHYEVDGNEELLTYLKFNQPKPVPQTLNHGDCTIDNVLVKDGKVYAFIDLAGVAYGDPRYDLALATRSIQSNPFLVEAFYEGYDSTPISIEEFKYFDGGLYEFF
ncbi:aminoglycoside phosphotransferase family protein [Psychrobacillus sp. FSL K6-4046]|uniref:phosphotransferase family protein n=1 Tax=Psychrobacillus sp. FSL K6-4046 TaxID=2921550 RepID=UPI003159C630